MPKKRANYTEEEKAIALAYYHECHSAKKTVRDLGYPVRSCLNNWIATEGKPKQPRKKNSINKGMSTFEERLDVVHRCVDLFFQMHDETDDEDDCTIEKVVGASLDENNNPNYKYFKTSYYPANKKELLEWVKNREL